MEHFNRRIGGRTHHWAEWTGRNHTGLYTIYKCGSHRRLCATDSAMPDEIIDAALARGLHIDAKRRHTLVGWIVMNDPPEYPDKIIARLMTDAPTPYVLIADTLA